MDNIVNLRDLLLEQVLDLYDAEKIQSQFLPSIKEYISSISLKNTVLQHILDTKEHVRVLEEVISILGATPEKEDCSAIKSMVDQSYHLIERCKDPEVADAAIIAALQHIEHYEIVSYGNICAYAQLQDEYEIADMLHKVLEQEKHFDVRLSELAQEGINIQAKTAVSVD